MPAFNLDAKTNLDLVLRRLGDVERNQIPFLTAYALTKTAQDIKAEQVAVMARVFDRPTRFTLNALYVKPATKTDLHAKVEFKEGFGSVPAWRYLGPEIEGGNRRKKSFELALQRAGILDPGEYVVPGVGAKLDGFGNMRGSEISKILSQLGASPDPMQNATRSRRSRSKRARSQYIVLRGTKARDGIYLRKAGNVIIPVMVFVGRPNYRKRYPHFETAREVFGRNLAKNFRDGWQRFVASQSARRAG
jgi:hypothetical protein